MNTTTSTEPPPLTPGTCRLDRQHRPVELAARHMSIARVRRSFHIFDATDIEPDVRLLVSPS